MWGYSEFLYFFKTNSDWNTCLTVCFGIVSGKICMYEIYYFLPFTLREKESGLTRLNQTLSSFFTFVWLWVFKSVIAEDSLNCFFNYILFLQHVVWYQMNRINWDHKLVNWIIKPRENIIISFSIAPCSSLTPIMPIPTIALP